MGYKKEARYCWNRVSPRRRMFLIAASIALPAIFFGLFAGGFKHFLTHVTTPLEDDYKAAEGLAVGFVDVFNVEVVFNSFVTFTNTARVTIRITPPPRFINNSRLIVPFDLWLGDNVKSFVVGAPGATHTFSADLISTGDVIMYPFDDYVVPVTISILPPDIKTADTFDMNIRVTNTPVYGFEFRVTEYVGKTYSLLTISVHADRTSLFLLYPYFLIVAYWLCNVWLLAMGVVIILWGARISDAGVVARYVGLLFAFPGFRSTAPGSPPFGCYLDYCAFYWSMFLVVASLFIGAFRNVLAPGNSADGVILAPTKPAPTAADKDKSKDGKPADKDKDKDSKNAQTSDDKSDDAKDAKAAGKASKAKKVVDSKARGESTSVVLSSSQSSYYSRRFTDTDEDDASC